jgi:hypothetical protein
MAAWRQGWTEQTSELHVLNQRRISAEQPHGHTYYEKYKEVQSSCQANRKHPGLLAERAIRSLDRFGR